MKEKKIVRFFLYMFFLYSGLSFIVPILYWTVSKDFEQLTKIPFYFSIITVLLFVVGKKFLTKDWFVIFLLVYSVFSLIVGLIFNDLSRVFLSHSFPYVLPIVCLSFGWYVAKNHPSELNWFVGNIPKLGWFLALTCIIYFVSFRLGYLDYYGASSLLILPFAFYYVRGCYIIALFYLMLIVLSGKRSDLVCLILSVLTFSAVRKPVFSVIVLLPFAFVSIYLLYHFGFLDRFSPLLVLIKGEGDLVLLNEFSSNRFNDILGALESINKSPFYWIFGQGFGVTYTYDAVSYYHTVHFTHFSPVSYILLGGVILFVAVYFKFLYLLIKSMKSRLDIFNFYFVFLFFLSLLGGSIFFTNPFYWFVVGIVNYKVKWGQYSKNTGC